ncbi:uncharacterized protein LOC124277023 isoform X3 [Haliotis rubra]|uniref:uncharacterized protein LOC124277023 isoform X3 n=1 Tax=Haliotis rubra TaxID=36100 RepID=UPI001EE61FF2|nr:uncharacterized protein LOC124277023 isoform X3 [Haliotis rubra]
MGSLPGNKDGAVSMDTPQSSGSDTETTDDRSPDTATSKVGKNTSYTTTTVKGSENSTVTDSTVIGAAHGCTFNQGEKQKERLSCIITEGANPKLKISVPAQDGGTLIYVDCSNATFRDWYYCQNVDIEKAFASIWTFGNIFDGFKAPIINGETGDAFFDLTAKLMKRYGCLLYKVYKRCLVIEFLHETEEGRNKMIKEQDTVRQMFQKFLESVEPNAPVCTLEVKGIETPTLSAKPDTASKYTGHDVSLDSTPSRPQARSPEIEEEQMSEFESYLLREKTHPEQTGQGVRVSLTYASKQPRKQWMIPETFFKKEHAEETDRGTFIELGDRSDCKICLGVRHDCEDDLSRLENVFFTHVDHPKTPMTGSTFKLQFSKILTAIGNSHGGVLILHGSNIPGSLDFQEYINRIIGSIFTQEIDQCEVFKTQKIGKYKYMLRIDVEPSDIFLTLDYKTKFSEDKLRNASNEKVRRRLFSSRISESSNADLRGIFSQHQNRGALRLNCQKDYAVSPMQPGLLHTLVSEMTRLSVPEHVSALSKKKNGGTIHVVYSELKFDEIPLDLQKRIKDHLMQAMMEKFRIQKNKHSKHLLQVSDVFYIELSKDTETGGCIIEIAVGHVNGCVFYDPEGPESYTIEGDKCVRLPFRKWIEEAFE